MYDGSAVAAAELRFREDLWRTAPKDAVEEAEVQRRWFGPILVTVFGDLPDTSLLNIVQGAAEAGAVEQGHLAGAVEWMRSREVDYLVSVTSERPGTLSAEHWLSARGYEPSSTVHRYLHSPTENCGPPPGRIRIHELTSYGTEGMSHIFASSLGLSGLATVLLLGLPDRPGWHCYSAQLDGREAACGAMLILDKVAILGLDATLPEARGCGCQSALISRRLVDATRAGCDTLIAEVCAEYPASFASAANLERAGFVEVGGHVNWRRPSGEGHGDPPTVAPSALRLSAP